MGDLKPCPFCGGDVERITIEDDSDPANFGGDVIQCRNCLASSRVEFGGKENLSAAWNRRAVPPDVTALVAAATDLRDQIARWHDGAPPAGPDESRALFEALDGAITAWEAANDR